MSIKVAVRVRPFNERELKSNPRCCIEMNGPQTVIRGDGVPERTFTFDYSFWSHDSFDEEDGVMVPSGPGSNYAD